MRRVAIIGGGPAGLMAAEVLAATPPSGIAAVNGLEVAIFDAMPSVGRKFLIAGKGGMNITHSKDLSAFKARYGKRESQLAGLLDVFGPDQLRDWIHPLRDSNLRRYLGAGFSHRNDARLAASPARAGRAFPCAASLAGLAGEWARLPRRLIQPSPSSPAR